MKLVIQATICLAASAWLLPAPVAALGSCSNGYFRCSDGWCLPTDFVCDGDADCFDAGDEKNCPDTGSADLPTLPCTESEFRCARDGRCVSKLFVCDGHRDCSDGSDEANCTSTRTEHCLGFHCLDGSKCIPKLSRCDGTVDCADASDELNCPRSQRGLLDLLMRDECRSGFECGGVCLNHSQVCNARRECPNGEDEDPTLCAHYECSALCDHFCRHHHNASTCACRPGFQLVGDRQCRPTDLCMANGCSQKCDLRNPQGSATCKCSEGFKLSASKRCVLEPYQEQPVVLFSLGHQVRELNVERRQYFEMYNDANTQASVLSFDMDVAEGKLYVIAAEQAERGSSTRIMASVKNGRPTAVFKKIKYDQLVDIAVDWITKNIYLVDGQHASIVVCRADNEMCAELFTKLGYAHYIVLDPTNGRLFWSDFDENQRGIYQGSMDGKSKRPLVTENVANPYGLALDTFADRLYWLDATHARVEFVSLALGTRGQLVEMTSGHTPSGIAVFGENLYWSELSRHRSSVSVCDTISGGANSSVLLETGTNRFVFTLRAYQPLMQAPRSNPCWGSPCSHICVLAGPKERDFSCLCPRYFSLVSKTECELTSSTYLVAAGNKLFRLPADAARRGDVAAQGVEMRVPSLGAMAVDDAEDMLYAVEDEGTPKLIRMSLRGDYHPELVDASTDFVSSLHFDPFHRVLYWLDIAQNVVGIYNPRRNETSRINLHRDQADVIPVDFAVDFQKGLIYVVAVDHNKAARFIDVYLPNGKLVRELQDVSPKPSRIAVGSDGTLFVYDAEDKRILSMPALKDDKATSVETDVVVHNVSYVHQLRFINDRLVWTGSRQRGFFVASDVGWKISQVVRDSWDEHTSAVSFLGDTRQESPRNANENQACRRANGGCSHTCIGVEKERALCICPFNMQIGPNGKTCIQKPKATCHAVTEFACANGYQCIPAEQKCNGIAQCDDRSDESAVGVCEKCPQGMFKCLTSTGCVSQAALCDGDYDCADRSDERNCTAASANDSCHDGYRCRATRKCIGKDRLCDGHSDCAYGDDEEGCPCATGQYRCNGGHCIAQSAVCDGWEDCWEGDDERNCKRTCPSDTHACGDACVGIELLCDGYTHCNDGSDEKNCTTVAGGKGQGSNTVPDFCAKRQGAVWCDGLCILADAVCDGVRDCRDGRDEANCDAISGGGSGNAAVCANSDHFHCNNGKCIPPGLTCDGEDDCGDHSDEQLDHCASQRAHEDAQQAAGRCFADEFSCADQISCVRIDQVCDGRADCPDASDEGRHCPRHECRSSPCQHDCHETPDGFRCSCRQGFRLSTSNHRSCEDIDECAEDLHQCSHYCENTKGGYACSCGMGYKMVASDNRTCAVESNDPVLLFTAHNQLRAMSKRHHSLHVLAAAQEGLIGSLTFDASFETVYWSEDSTVWSMPIGDHVIDPHPVQVARQLMRPRQLAFDWTTGNMYFVDATNRVAVCGDSLNRTSGTAVFTHCTHLDTPSGLSDIRSLALASNEGLLFMSYWAGDLKLPNSSTNANGVVLRMQMDGSDQTVISTNNTLRPSHLQVDFIHRRLYLVDTELHIIESFDFNGRHRKVLRRGHSAHAFALFPDSVFWSEQENILMADWFEASRIKVIAADAHATAMTVMHRVRQPLAEREAACQKAACQQLCLLNAHGATCVCDAQFQLQADNRTCAPAAAHHYDHAADEAGRLDSGGLAGCDPACLNGGTCLLRQGRTRAVCFCPRGFSGAFCEVAVGQPASTLSTVLAICLLLATVGAAIIFVVYRYNGSIFGGMNLSATYRATDMKKLVDEEGGADGGDAAAAGGGGDDFNERALRHGAGTLTLTNPLYTMHDFNTAAGGGQRDQHEERSSASITNPFYENQQPSSAPSNSVSCSPLQHQQHHAAPFSDLPMAAQLTTPNDDFEKVPEGNLLDL